VEDQRTRFGDRSYVHTEAGGNIPAALRGTAGGLAWRLFFSLWRGCPFCSPSDIHLATEDFHSFTGFFQAGHEPPDPLSGVCFCNAPRRRGGTAFFQSKRRTGDDGDAMFPHEFFRQFHRLRSALIRSKK